MCLTMSRTWTGWKPLSMSLAAVVQHVQILEVSGLVRT